MVFISVVIATLIATFTVRYLSFKFGTFKYYLKYFMCYVWLLTWCAFLIPYCLLRPRNVSNIKDVSHILKYLSVPSGIKITLRGREILGKDESCMIVANHQDDLDLVGTLVLWNVIGKMTAIASHEVLYVGSYGILAWLSGMIFIDRKAGVKAGQAMSDAMVHLKTKKIKLLVFAEGKTQNTREIHEFKKGAFHSAIHAQVPIVPVVFSTYSHFLDAKKKIFNSGEVIITALPEIPTEGLTTKDVDDLIKRTRDAMIETYNATSNETERSGKF